MGGRPPALSNAKTSVRVPGRPRSTVSTGCTCSPTGDTRQIVDLTKQAGARAIVVLSSASAGFDNDPGGEFHRVAERAVEDSGMEWTHVRPGMFAGNLLGWADAIRTEGVVKAPYNAARQSPVHELDVSASPGSRPRPGQRRLSGISRG